MQHDHILKKMKFDLLTPSPGSVCVCVCGGGGGGGDRGSAGNLICNMTMF